MSRLKIVLFVSSLSAGGTERVAVRVVEWLHAAGHELCLLTMAGADSDFYPTPPGVTRIGLDLLRPSRGMREALLLGWRRLSGIRAIVRARRPDVVIALADQVNITMLLALVGIDCRKIISERSDPAIGRQPLAWRVLRRLAYPMATLHVAQSSHVARWIHQRFPRLPGVVIGNTAGEVSKVVPGEARGDATGGGRLKIVTVARLSREKGLDLLLEAFAAATARGASIELSIVGDGPQRAALEAQADALGIATAVTFAGRVADVVGTLRASDIAIMPSRLEGFPNALVEALAAGLPTIAARCPGGAADVLGDVPGRYALDFPPGDVPALTEAIVRLAASSELRRTLAAAALDRAADYAPNRIAAAWRSAVETAGVPANVA